MYFKCKRMKNYKNEYSWKKFKDLRGAYEVRNFVFYKNSIFSTDEVHSKVILKIRR